jgi:hypothetical protein
MYWNGSALTVENSSYGTSQIGLNRHGGGHITFETGAVNTAASEKARVDSSGNLLVGKTSAGYATDGFEARQNGETYVSRSGTPMAINRNSSEGILLNFYKDGGGTGSISTNGNDLIIGTNYVGVKFNDQLGSIYPYHSAGTSAQDNAVDLGYPTARFRNAYLSGGVYLGGTGSANKLDDYEEGTWNLGTNSDPTGVIAANSYGLYRRVGDLVFVQAVFQVSTNFTNYSISGLPFNPKNENTIVSSVHSMGTVRASNAVVFAQVSNGSNLVTFLDSSGAGYVPTTVRDPFRFGITYRAV